MNKQRTLSHRWVLKKINENTFIAYDIYRDIRIKVSKSLFLILSIFKYQSISINNLSEKIPHLDKLALSKALLSNESLADILVESMISHSINEANTPTAPNRFCYNFPTDIEIHITEKCNLTCRHCGYSCGPESDIKEIPAKEWIKLFDEFEDHNIFNVMMSGGELFSYKEIDTILEDISRRRFRVELLTNGLLIKDKHLDYFTPNIGLNISLDGDNAEDHEFLRGKNTFKRTIRIIEKLKERNKTVNVSTTITKRNMNKVEDIVKFAITLNIDGLNFSLVDHIGRSREDIKLHLDKNDRIYLNELIKKLTFKYKEQISLYFIENSNPSIPKEIQHINNKEIVICSAAISRATISSDGNVYPCVYAFGDMSMVGGNITKHSFLKIWNTNRWNMLRGETSLDDLHECRDCDLVNICVLKICRLRALSYDGDFYAAPFNCPKMVYV